MKILIGYDGSESSDLALEDLKRAGLPAEAEALVVTIAEAWELPEAVSGVPPAGAGFVHPSVAVIERHLSDLTERAGTLAARAAARVREMFPRWQVAAEASCGKPAFELVKLADQCRPDLIVTGSHGRSALGRLLLGSVSQKVLHEARCSVRISRKPPAAGGHLRILLAVDGSADAENMVAVVAGRSWDKNTEARLIAVDDPFSRSAASYLSWNLSEDGPENTEEARAWIERVVAAPGKMLQSAGLNVSETIRWGDAANVILREAEEWQADTIFLGARGLGPVKRFLLGSVSSQVAAKAHCSVEIVRLPS